ncbi:MAG: N-acyl amino acid synthase of PEP-CTERM/exosortase system [Motiliproteus sp.]|jgi:N-acyl amino acid synthase of PEP-CTERM/exosortase system
MVENEESRSIASLFGEYFRVRFAGSDTLKEAVYRVRYQVYCEELHWEPENSAGLERDEFDRHSLHCLLEHRRTGDFAGCIRLILASEQDLLPFERFCRDAIDPTILDPASLVRDRFGEISRLAVPAAFRKRLREQGKPYVLGEQRSESDFSPLERRQFPHIAIGMYLASLALVELLDHEYVFVMMEPRLMRHLRLLGIHFGAGGEPIDYHGIRGLFYLHRDNLSRHFPPELKELYTLIYASLQGGLPKGA